MQLGQSPAVLPVGQGPGGGVGAQQLDGGRVLVFQGHPALQDVVAHPVVQRDGQSAVAEPQPQLVTLGVVRLEAPLGAAPLVGAHGQGRAGEAGAALDGVLLASVERGLERPVIGQRADGEGLGVGEGDPRAPVQVQQLVLGGEVQGVTAGRPGQNPCTAVLGDLQHRASSQIRTGANRGAQAATSSMATRPGCNGCGQVIAGPVDNSLPQEPMSYGRERARRRAASAEPGWEEPP